MEQEGCHHDISLSCLASDDKILGDGTQWTMHNSLMATVA
jgi:hypothetical protein